VFAVMRLSPNPVMRWVAFGYVWLFRGTPVFLQLLLWFNLALIFPTIGLFGLFEVDMVDVMSPFLAAMLGLSICEGSYLTEIVRAGILSVDKGQTEAAMSTGMSNTQTLRRIVLPQAMRVIIPPYGNEFIGLLKTSAMASVIAYPEVLQVSQQIYFVNAKVIELLMVATGWYLIIVSIFSVGQYFLERRFSRGQSQASGPGAGRTILGRVFSVPAWMTRGTARPVPSEGPEGTSDHR
jgi:polar amino acid transport system permease protein